MGERVEGDQRTENLSKGIVKMVNKRIQLHHDQYLFPPAPSSHTIPEFPVGRLQLWRTQWHPTPVLLPGKSHGWRSLVGTVHGVAKSQTRLNNFNFTFRFHALEKEMATQSCVLAWRIPGTGEPGGLPSIGLHRVRHN